MGLLLLGGSEGGCQRAGGGRGRLQSCQSKGGGGYRVVSLRGGGGGYRVVRLRGGGVTELSVVAKAEARESLETLTETWIMKLHTTRFL